MSEKLEAHRDRLLELTAAGLGLGDAAREAGVSINTLKHWLRIGRAGREPYATFAKQLEDARPPEPPREAITRDELLRLAGDVARKGSVPAMRLCMELLEDAPSDEYDPLAAVDEIAEWKAAAGKHRPNGRAS